MFVDEKGAKGDGSFWHLFSISSYNSYFSRCQKEPSPLAPFSIQLEDLFDKRNYGCFE